MNILAKPNDEPDTKRIYGLLHLFLVKILAVNQDRRVLRATYITWPGFAKDYHRHHKSYSLYGAPDRLDQQPRPLLLTKNVRRMDPFLSLWSEFKDARTRLTLKS